MTNRTEIVKLIEKRIEYSRKDSFLNHIRTIFLFQWGLSGEVNSEGFKIWSYSHWVGIFYPVFQGKFNSMNDDPNIQITSKLNSLGTSFAVVLSVIWLISIISMVLQGDNNWTYLWKRSLLGFILFIIPYVTFGYAIVRQHKIERKEIENECQQWLRKHAGTR